MLGGVHAGIGIVTITGAGSVAIRIVIRASATTLVHLTIAVVVDTVGADLGPDGHAAGGTTIAIADQHTAASAGHAQVQAFIHLPITVVINTVADLLRTATLVRLSIAVVVQPIGADLHIAWEH